MSAEAELAKAWGPYEGRIREVLRELAEAAMPEEADFLWFVLMPGDLRGMPILVWPTERNQQQHDGWECEYELSTCVPDSVELPDLAGTPENLDVLRDACAAYMQKQWAAIQPLPGRLAYFSINEDGWYFSMRDGRRISAWDIQSEIDVQEGSSLD